MKKTVSLVLVLMMVMTFAGCRNSSEATEELPVDDNQGTQLISDMSVKAKEYANQLLETMLKDKGAADYQITQSNSGFLTGDRVVFLVGFQYTRDGAETVYGYKLAVNEDLTFTVMEEGTSTGEFIMQ